MVSPNNELNIDANSENPVISFLISLFALLKNSSVTRRNMKSTICSQKHGKLLTSTGINYQISWQIIPAQCIMYITRWNASCPSSNWLIPVLEWIYLTTEAFDQKFTELWVACCFHFIKLENKFLIVFSVWIAWSKHLSCCSPFEKLKTLTYWLVFVDAYLKSGTMSHVYSVQTWKTIGYFLCRTSNRWTLTGKLQSAG